MSTRRVIKEEDRKRPYKPRPYKPQTVNGILLDVRAASALMGNSERSMRALIARGVVPFQKLEGRVVFNRRVLERWIENLPGLSVKDAELNRKVRSKQ